MNLEHCANFEFYLGDLNASPVSGNKLHKLAPQIDIAKARGCAAILSFGGPYSNHLHALAWACKQNGLDSIAYVRGELPKELTPTLQDCQQWGMQLRSLSRDSYRELQGFLHPLEAPVMVTDLPADLLPSAPDSTLVVPEGAGGSLAIESLHSAYYRVLSRPEYQSITHVACATGTGATLAGLAKAAPEHMQVIGVQAVSEADATQQRISRWLGGEIPTNLKIVPGHLGRFAKTTPDLLAFIENFEREYLITLDPIYNGKVVYKLAQMVRGGELGKDDSVLVIHTGGLQGKRGVSVKSQAQ